MHVEHHPLIKDFLKSANNRSACARKTLFARKAEEYEALDKRICRIEDGVETLDDAALTALKQERVTLKDDIARDLRRASGSCCGGCCG